MILKVFRPFAKQLHVGGGHKKRPLEAETARRSATCFRPWELRHMRATGGTQPRTGSIRHEGML
jgi:hypothetical protein